MARNKYPEQTVKLILDVSTRLFVEKGYEHTSLQDIINETKLSKGAIYHHFSSKEEIFEAIFRRIGEENSVALAKIRDDKKLNGYEKLKAIFKAAYFNPNQSLMLTVTPPLLENPKFLAMQIQQLYDIVVPKFIEPILQQGIDDGTISTKNPREVAEVIMILNNVWLNPVVRYTDEESMRNRCYTFNQLLRGLGIDLLDDAMIEEYVKFCSKQDTMK